MEIPSLLRRAEHDALSQVSLDGEVLDLGGEAESAYHACIGGTHQITTVNLDPGAKSDIVHDLEMPLPVANAAFDHVLLINVLEHIFNYQQLINESVRVIKPGGTVTLVMPFLFPVHPSPQDYWRFTEEALRLVLEASGLSVTRTVPLGGGVFSARYVMLDRLLPFPVRMICSYTLRFLASALDYVFLRVARLFRKKYLTQHYVLGYLVTAQKPTT